MGSALDLFSLNGKKAVVTGASRGIGQALAIGLAEAGADVAVLARTEADLHDTARRIGQAGRTSLAVVCDVSAPDSIRSAFAAIRRQWQSIDILVNNAGINIRDRALDVTDEVYDKVVETNLRSAFVCSQEAARMMIDACRGGRIVNIASVAAVAAVDTGTPYAAAKAGMGGMARSLALEWGRHGITVNCIAPWYFRTPLTEKVLADPRIMRRVLARTPLGRVGEMNDLVGATIFLASQAGAYVTGQMLVVDGGVTIFAYSALTPDA